MKLYRAAELRAADSAAAAAGISTWRLMEAAGGAVARLVAARYPDVGRATVLCGKGNNGGDGYVCARQLAASGWDVKVLELTAEPGTPDARRARADLVGAGTAAPLDAGTNLGEAGVIVDALFGSGLNRPVEGWLGELLARLHEHGAPVVAVDVPSGVPSDVPQLFGPHVRATLTVELAGHKVAGAFYPTRAAYGERVLAPIGIPPAVLAECGTVQVITGEEVAAWLPRRAPDAHKYSAGTVTVVGGSARYSGAAELASRGAWRAGAGLVTIIGPTRHPAAWPETIFELWTPSEGSAAQLRGAFVPKRAAATVIGPGLDERALAYLPELLRLAPGPVVIDAAALTPRVWPRAERSALRTKGGATMTPHAGEAAQLLGSTAAAVTGDPLGAAAALAAEFGAVVVLKGPTTVVAAPDGRAAISERGHPGMASGGTGDVLAGVLGALLAPAGGREEQFTRVCAGVWLHGVAGELAATTAGLGLVASDLAAALPLAAARAAATDMASE